MKEHARVRPLREPLVLYVDASEASDTAVYLLKKSGFPAQIIEGIPEKVRVRPCVYYHGREYTGLSRIMTLIEQLEYGRSR